MASLNAAAGGAAKLAVASSAASSVAQMLSAAAGTDRLGWIGVDGMAGGVMRCAQTMCANSEGR